MSRSPSSYTISTKQFDHFAAWCKPHGTTPFFASPEVIAAYLSDCAARETYSPVTIARLGIGFVLGVQRFGVEVTQDQKRMLLLVVAGIECDAHARRVSLAKDKDSTIRLRPDPSSSDEL